MTRKNTSSKEFLKKIGNPKTDTLVSDAIMQHLVKSMQKKMRLSRKYDVPYLGGSSKRGTIYIDRRLPKTFQSGRLRVKVDPYIALHEAVERVVGDAFSLPYQLAHQIALRVEEAAVRAAGITWRDYDRFMQENLDRAMASFSLLPPDLDHKPYLDENDTEMLQRMRQVTRSKRPRSTGRR